MKKLMFVILTLLLLTGCSEVESRVYSEADQTDLEKILNERDDITGYTSVMNKDDILVAIEVGALKRFQKTKIESKLKKAIEKEYPGKEVLVTGDMKIRWEIEKIVDKKQKDEELTKSIEKLKSLSKEET